MSAFKVGVARVCWVVLALGCAGQESADAASDPSGAAGGASGDRAGPPPGGRPIEDIEVLILGLQAADPPEPAEPGDPAPAYKVFDPGEQTCAPTSGGAPSASADCADNQPPVLGDVAYVVDGRIYEERPDELGSAEHPLLVVPFADPDCNLACGPRSFTFTFEGEGAAAGSDGVGASGGELLPAGLPCSTEQSGVYLGVWAPSANEAPGRYEFILGVNDTCGASAGVRVTHRFR